VSVLLEARGVSKRFGGVRAVDSVDLAVEAGTITSVIGPNGAGKTTLFNIISAVLRPDEGSIVFDGHELTRLRPHQIAGLGIGRTFQNLAVFRRETVINNLLVGMHHRMQTNIFTAALFWGPARREEIEMRLKARKSSTFSRSSISATCLSAPCPMACRNASSWAAPWRPIRNFSCSTKWSPA
jgi:branched-chain amino acid transport system ATP-binding protein